MKISRKKCATSNFITQVSTCFAYLIQSVVVTPHAITSVGQSLYGSWIGALDILVLGLTFESALGDLVSPKMSLAHSKKDYRSLNELFTAALIITIGCIGILISMAYVLTMYLPVIVRVAPENQYYLQRCFIINILFVGINAVNTCLYVLAQSIQLTQQINNIQLVGVIFGVALTILAMYNGYGLYSFVIGTIARVFIFSMGSLFFVHKINKGCFRIKFAWNYNCFVLILKHFPLSILGFFCLISLSVSNILIVYFCSPATVIVYNITRRLIELMRMVVERVSYACAPGFAHYLNSSSMPDTARLFNELSQFNLTLALSMSVSYIFANATLINLWIGNKYFGGPLLQFFLAVSMVVSNQSLCYNTLCRYSGHNKQCYYIILTEFSLLIVLGICLLKLVGPVGFPIAQIVSSSVSLLIMKKWVNRLMPLSTIRTDSFSVANLLFRILIVFAAICVCFTGSMISNYLSLILTPLVFFASLIIQVRLDPALARINWLLMSRFNGIVLYLRTTIYSAIAMRNSRT